MWEENEPSTSAFPDYSTPLGLQPLDDSFEFSYNHESKTETHQSPDGCFLFQLGLTKAEYYASEDSLASSHTYDFVSDSLKSNTPSLNILKELVQARNIEQNQRVGTFNDESSLSRVVNSSSLELADATAAETISNRDEVTERPFWNNWLRIRWKRSLLIGCLISIIAIIAISAGILFFSSDEYASASEIIFPPADKNCSDGALNCYLDRTARSLLKETVGAVFWSPGNCSERTNPNCTSLDTIHKDAIENFIYFVRNSSCNHVPIRVLAGTGPRLRRLRVLAHENHASSWGLYLSFGDCLVNYIVGTFYKVLVRYSDRSVQVFCGHSMTVKDTALAAWELDFSKNNLCNRRCNKCYRHKCLRKRECCNLKNECKMVIG